MVTCAHGEPIYPHWVANLSLKLRRWNNRLYPLRLNQRNYYWVVRLLRHDGLTMWYMHLFPWCPQMVVVYPSFSKMTRWYSVIEGRLDRFLPHWLRAGWQSVVSQGEIPWNTPPWPGIEQWATFDLPLSYHDQVIEKLFNWSSFFYYSFYMHDLLTVDEIHQALICLLCVFNYHVTVTPPMEERRKKRACATYL